MFTLIMVISSFFNLNAGCIHKTDEFTCDYFAPCVWNKSANKCEFGPRGLNSDREAYSLNKDGTPKLRAGILSGR